LTTNEDSPVTIYVSTLLSNDSDPESNTLTFSRGDSTSNGSLVYNNDNTYTYTPNNNFNGPDRFTYTASDSEYSSAPASVIINVTPVNDPPYFTSEDSLHFNENQTGTIVDINAIDPEGNNITLSLTSGYIDNNLFSLSTDGILTFNNTPDYENPTNQDGNNIYKVSITATDDAATPASSTQLIEIYVDDINEAPVFGTVTDTSIKENQTTVITLTTTDPENDEITYTLPQTGDNSFFSVAENGNLTFNTPPNYEDPADADGNNTYNVTVSATDNGNPPQTSSISFTVNVTNVDEAPIVTNDTYETDEDTQLQVTTGLLSNDSDEEGSPLSITSHTEPANGTITNFNNNDGTFIYTPAENFNGKDSISYTVSDGTNTSSGKAYFNVGGVNDPPIVNDDTYTIHEDGTLTVPDSSGILKNDNDPDQDALIATVIKDVNNGTFNLNNNDGSFTYTPHQNFYGRDTLIYKASDGLLESIDSALVVITVTSVNDAPVAVNDTVTVDEGGTIVINVVENDYDIDGTLDLTTITVTNVTNGTIESNTNGEITFTHDGSETSSAGFSYTVNDNNGESSNTANVIIDVTPVNDIPVITDINGISVNEGGSVNINLIENFSDNDGTPDVSSINITDLTNGSYSDNGNGTITFTHDGSETSSAGFSYTINDDKGATSNEAVVSLTVNPVNDAPVFTSPDTAFIEENQANVMAVEATDAENNTIEYSLDTGDDNALFAINNTTGVLSFSSLPDYENPKDNDGNNNYIVTVLATDDGTPTVQISSKTIVVIVTDVNEVPVVEDDSYTIFEDDTLTTNITTGILANDEDPDGDSLAITIQRDVSYGELIINPDGSFSYIPQENYNGEDSFTYTVSDGVNGSYIATVTITITAVNDIPVVYDDSYSVDEDSHLSVSITDGVLNNDRDPDNTELSVSLQDSVSHGSLSLLSDGSFQYSPDPDYNGIDVFTYTANDGQSTSNRAATVTITVNSVNDAPVVQNDSYETNEDVLLNIDEAGGVLSNDSDPDDDALSASIADSVSHGVITLNPNGSFRFEPDTNYYGTDQFTYTVSDGTVSSAEVTVSITIVSINDNPVANDDAGTVNEGSSTQINIVANDNDVDGTLDYSTINISNVTNGSYIDNGNGTITFTHDGSETTSAGFSYTIKDDLGALSNVADVEINVVQENDVPVANNDEATVNEGESVIINIIDNDTDADGTLDTTSIIFSNIINGECVNNNDGTVTFTHDGSETTSASFSYTINDNVGATSNLANVSITVIPQNDPPFTVDDDAVVNEGDTVIINILSNDTDPDGTININSVLIGNITNGYTTDNKDGSVTFIHDGSETTSAGFAYTVSDDEGSVSRLTNVSITVNPVNDAPVFTSEQNLTIYENQYDVITVTATDAENNTIAYTLTNEDDNDLFDINSSTGALTFKTAPDYESPVDADHNNVYIVTVTATDNGSPARSVTMQITVTVLDVNEAPVAVDDSYWINEDDTLNVDAPGVIENDNDQENDELSANLYTNVSHGNLLFSNDGSFRYIPESNYNGTDYFTYYLNDKTSNSDTVTVELVIQPQNDAPVAVADSYNSEEDKTLIVNSPGVLANDYDIDNNTLTAVLTLSPDNGTLTLNSDGSFTYQPNQNFAGIDTFKYVANDGNLTSEEVEVIINIGQTNDAPVSSDDSYTVNEDETLIVEAAGVLANDDDPDNNSLTANLVSTVSHGTLTLNLNGSLTYTPDNNYNGTDKFTYQASDGQVTGNIATVSITIQAVNDPPVAANDYFYTAEDIPDNINVISNDSDPNDVLGGIASNSIVIVSAPVHGTALISGDRINYSPYSRFYGNDTLTYAVFDTGYPTPALSDTAFVFIKVARRHPLAINDTVSTNEDVATDINILQNDQDIDIDPTTVTIGTPPSHGTITVDATTGIVSYIPDKDYFGLAEDGNGDGFTYYVKDKTGLSSDLANVVINILPVPDPPVTSDVIRSTAEDIPVSINIDEITTDPDNDLNYNSVEFIKLPGNGTVTSNSENKEIVYTPDTGFSGNDTLSFRISDLEGNISNTSEIIITVSNEAPNANNDSYTINEDQTAVLNVLENDTDPQDNIVPDSLRILTMPLHGTVVINSSEGTITYTPDKDYFGNDNLTYKITDATNYSDQAQVSITINSVNDPPVAVDDNIETQEDQSLEFDVISNDFDIDNQIDSASVSIFKAPLHGQISFDESTHLLNYIPETNFYGTDSMIYEISDVSNATSQGIVHINVTPVEDPPEPQHDNITTNEETAITYNIILNDIDIENDIDSCSIIITTLPENGNVSISGEPECGYITYTPNENFLGTDNFTYQISDTTGLTGQASVTITVNNLPDPPVAEDDNYSFAEDSTIILNVLLNDHDADNNIDSSLLSIVTYPANGSIEIQNNRIIYTPAPDYNGTDKFEYQVCDSTNLCDTASVYLNITPVNDYPVAGDDEYSLYEDESITMNVLINDADADNNIDSTKLIILTPASHGNLEIVNNRIKYIPEPDYSGKDIFTYRICDYTNLCDTATVTITVIPVNDPPVANDNNYSMLEDETLIMNVLYDDTDPDNNIDSTKLSILESPRNGSIEIANNRIIYTPSPDFNGNDQLTYQICDSTNLCSSANVNISITPVNDAPVAVNDNGRTIPGEPTIRINVAGNDYDVDNNLNISSITIVTYPLHGSVETEQGTGFITYFPDEDYYGNDSFSYRICDTNNECDIATVFLTITTGNVPPETEPDYINTDEDTPVNISPLANDSDPNNNIDASSLKIISDATHGTTLVDNLTGSISYTPELNYNGSDIIVYEVCDTGEPPLCSGDTIFITISPVNDSPVAGIVEAETYDNSSVDIDVLSYCTDPENDPLTISVSEHSPELNGTVSVNEDGTINYTPDQGTSCTTERIIYEVCDTEGLCDTASIYVRILPADSDGDNIPDFIEKNGDVDNDGTPNYLDDDSDNDGISDYTEGNITDPCNDIVRDTDGDFTPDYLDEDSDNDGYPDKEEGTDDCDNDGIPNYIDELDDCVSRLDVPDTFSPNGDGINDYFWIPGADELPNDHLYIYNRWGGLVYESDNYDNTWDGKSTSNMLGGDNLQEGTYFYIYIPDETMEPIKGTIYLKR